jgi:pimeloyl-ACP methyl ester carboxylesterase
MPHRTDALPEYMVARSSCVTAVSDPKTTARSDRIRVGRGRTTISNPGSFAGRASVTVTPKSFITAGLMGAATAQYQCVKVLSETEFYDDLKIIDVPVLVMHGEDDQICPFPTTGARTVKLLKQGTLKSYPGLPHGMPTTHAELINADLSAFIESKAISAAA